MFALLVDTHHLMSLSALHPGACEINPAAWRPGPAPIGHDPACDVCTDDPRRICAWSGAPASSDLVNARGTAAVLEGARLAGIGRVVYGQSEKELKAQTGAHDENPTLDLPCRIVFEAGQRPTEVVGPLLEDEAAGLQADFWAAHKG